MIQRPIEANFSYKVKEIDQTTTKATRSFSCARYCKDVSLAVSAIFFAYLAIRYYIIRLPYQAASSHHIPHKHVNIHSIGDNWINGHKNMRKRALQKIFKNEPNSDKLIRDCLSKLGQPFAGGKTGRTIQVLNMTLVSDSYCSWKYK